VGIFSVITSDPNLNNLSVNSFHHVRPHIHLLIREMRTSRKKNRLTAMTCLGEPKVETPEQLVVDNLPEVETLLKVMMRVILVLRPIVTDPMPHPLIQKSSLVAARAIGVEKSRTSTIDDMQLSISLFRSVIRPRSHLIC